MILQTPKYVYMNGGLRSWESANLHVGCEAATRGVNVFEGIQGYRQPDGSLAIVMLRQHYNRLTRSARLLHIPFDWSYETYSDAISSLSTALLEPGKEMWLRTTLFVVEGHWGENTVADMVITGYQITPSAPKAIALGVSTWRRSPDVSLPARIKTGTNYQVARLARIEGRVQGCQDMILLNDRGRVAESTGSSVVMVRDGVVITPPATEGGLESITVDAIQALAGSLGIPFIRRPIDRTELLIADELALCGTLAELIPVKSVENLALPSNAPVTDALRKRYLDAVRGINPHPAIELTRVVQPEPAECGDCREIALAQVTQRGTLG